MAKTVKIKLDQIWSDTRNQYLYDVEVQVITNFGDRPDNWEIAEALASAGFIKPVGGSVPVWKFEVIG